MSTKIIYLIASVFFCHLSIAQKTNCNRKVFLKSYEKQLPKEVCIPVYGDYWISEIRYEDINEDKLEDFIFDWNKRQLKDGDTIYRTVYLQNIDSSFSFLKTFNNLFPIYFERYDLDYIPKTATLNKLQKKYADFDPMCGLSFVLDTIRICVGLDAESNLVTIYKFDKTIKNWIYIKSEECFFKNIEEPSCHVIHDFDKRLSPTIDSFTYFIWDGYGD